MNKKVEEYLIKDNEFICFSNIYPMAEGDYLCRAVYKLPNKGLMLRAFKDEFAFEKFIQDSGVKLKQKPLFVVLNKNIDYRVANKECNEYYTILLKKSIVAGQTFIDTSKSEDYSIAGIKILDESVL